MAEALAALRTGRYAFEVAFDGERRRAELLDLDGAPRLVASSPLRGDLLDLLPEPVGQEQGGLVASVSRALHAPAAGDGPTAP
jgi:hypothetical protein